MKRRFRNWLMRTFSLTDKDMAAGWFRTAEQRTAELLRTQKSLDQAYGDIRFYREWIARLKADLARAAMDNAVLRAREWQMRDAFDDLNHQ